MEINNQNYTGLKLFSLAFKINTYFIFYQFSGKQFAPQKKAWVTEKLWMSIFLKKELVAHCALLLQSFSL